MLSIREAILVEGRYDKIRLSSLVDTEIFTSEGFGIFKDTEKMALLRSVAEKRGLIVFTDPDGAGLVIRNRIRQCIDEKYLKHAYIPEIPGKEKRKTAPSKEGSLGVEGVDNETLLLALRRCGITERDPSAGKITKNDMFDCGLSGRADSAGRRKELLKKLGFPENLSANALLNALNALYTREEFLEEMKKF